MTPLNFLFSSNLILDAIFGSERFLNEIAWKRSTAHNDASRYGRIGDRLLVYSKTEQKYFNPKSGGAYSPEQLRRYKKDPANGRLYKGENLTANHFSETRSFVWRGVHPGKRRQWRYGLDELERLYAAGLILLRRDGKPRKDGLKEYLDEQEGPALQDIWTDIVLSPTASERTGWQTQKPVELLKRIIAASSEKGQLVLDPFCGCGTTVEAAEELGRKWIGIDIAIRAIDVMKDRLDAKFQPQIWTEHGEPRDIEQAERLAENEYEFQWWAVRMLGGSPPKGEKKKGKDDGVDGELILVDDAGITRRGLISVKAGRNLTPDFVKTLHGHSRYHVRPHTGHAR